MVETRGGRRFAFLFFGVAFLVLLAGRWLNPLSHVGMTIAAPFQSVLTSGTNAVGDGFAGVFDGPRLRDQNLLYRRQIETLIQANIHLHDLQIQNAQYKALLHYSTGHPSLQLLPAKVIGTCQDENLDPCIFIDRGTRDGLRDRMTVVDPQGAYVGFIADATGIASRVTLLLNPSSSVGVRDVRSRITAVVEGTYAGKPRLRYAQTNQSLKPGDFIETSGQYELFPPGIMVGQVVSVQRADVSTFQSAVIEPITDFSNLERVAVVTNFRPANLSRLLRKP